MESLSERVTRRNLPRHAEECRRGFGTFLCATKGAQRPAWAEYREAAAKATKLNQPDRAQGAAEAAAQLEPTLSHLIIQAPPGPPLGFVVRRGGVTLADGSLGVAIPVDPGTHIIRASAPGHETVTTTVEVGSDGETESVQLKSLVKLLSKSLPAAAADDGTFNAGLVVGGVGLAALVVGGVFGALTLSQVADVEHDESLCGADKLCSPAGRAALDEAQTKGVASTILLGVGGLAVAVGAVLVIVGVNSSEPDVSAWLVPVVTPSGAQVVLGGSF